MKAGNSLIVIENNEINTYILDDKKVWEVGRASKDNHPDIELHSLTASRRHGKFQNESGEWFYKDYNGKNGTVYNKKHLEPRANGRVKPVMLNDGDVFVFGGGDTEIINSKTIWALYLTNEFDYSWSTVDSKGYSNIKFITRDGSTSLYNPQKGAFVKKEDGLAIYMGDVTYVAGNIEAVIS